MTQPNGSQEIDKSAPTSLADSLTFDQLREMNWRRANEFFGDVDEWSLLERAGEMTGEAGEAANFAKKLKRGWKIENGERIPFTPEERHELIMEFAKELADVIITTDLCAAPEGINLGEAVREKFNEKSEKWGCSLRL